MKNSVLNLIIVLVFFSCSKKEDPKNEPGGEYIVETVYENSSGLFSSMYGLCLEELNEEVIGVLVIDQVKNAIIKIPVNGAAGSAAVFAQLPKNANQQDIQPWYITNAGPYYYASTYGKGIIQISRYGEVSDYTGYANKVGHWEGSAAEAHFSDPRGLCATTGYLYVCDFGANCISQVNSNGNSAIFSGNPSTGASTKDGFRSAALFNHPNAIATNGNNEFLIAQENCVRKIDYNKEEVTTLAGPLMGYQDGKGTAAAFDNITGIAVDKSGNAYVADIQNCCIRRIAADGTTTTFAGKGDECGMVDGSAADSRFDFPFDISIAENGDFYITDSKNLRIRRIRKK